MVSLLKTLYNGTNSAIDVPKRVQQTSCLSKGTSCVTTMIEAPFKIWGKVRDTVTEPVAKGVVYCASPIINCTSDRLTEKCLQSFLEYSGNSGLLGEASTKALGLLVKAPTRVQQMSQVGSILSSASASALRWVGDNAPALSSVTESAAWVCDGATSVFNSARGYAEAVDPKVNLKKLIIAAKKYTATQAVQTGLNFVVDSAAVVYTCGGFSYVVDPTKLKAISTAQKIASTVELGVMAYNYGPVAVNAMRVGSACCKARNNLAKIDSALGKVNMSFNPSGLNYMLLALMDMGLLPTNEKELVKCLKAMSQSL